MKVNHCKNVCPHPPVEDVDTTSFFFEKKAERGNARLCCRNEPLAQMFSLTETQCVVSITGPPGLFLPMKS